MDSMLWLKLDIIFGFAFISFLHVVAGELAPKVLAFHKAETISMAVAWSINGLYKMLRWVIWVMERNISTTLWGWWRSRTC